jgi:hypothetical protein
MKKHYFASYLCVITAETLDLVGQKGSDAHLEKRRTKRWAMAWGDYGGGVWTARTQGRIHTPEWSVAPVGGPDQNGNLIMKNVRLVNGWDVADPSVKRRLASGTRPRSLTRAVQCL